MRRGARPLDHEDGFGIGVQRKAGPDGIEAVPEPSTFGLLIIAALFGLVHPRRAASILPAELTASFVMQAINAI